MKIPRITLEQWRILQAVVEYGGFAQAAEKLHRSQSAISYQISKMQEQLPTPVLVIAGRKAKLTPEGETLLRRAKQLLAQADALEEQALEFSRGWETELTVVIDSAFPQNCWIAALKEFLDHSHGIRLQLREEVLGGTIEALDEPETDFIVTAIIPEGYLGHPIKTVDMVAIAAPTHPLHRLKREVSATDLKQAMQIVVRDSGRKKVRDTGWLEAEGRCTVTSMQTALQLIEEGLGFAWQPQEQIQASLAAGKVKMLPLQHGQRRSITFYLVFKNAENIGPGARLFANIIEQTAAGCEE